jgi:hypothetical protein
MKLKQIRKSLRLSLRDAAALVRVSYEQIRLAEDGQASEAAVEAIRRAYKKAATKTTAKALAVAIPEKDLQAMKSKHEKFEPMSITITFRKGDDGRLRIGYAGDDPRTEAVGEAIVDAIVEVFCK